MYLFRCIPTADSMNEVLTRQSDNKYLSSINLNGARLERDVRSFAAWITPKTQMVVSSHLTKSFSNIDVFYKNFH